MHSFSLDSIYIVSTYMLYILYVCKLFSAKQSIQIYIELGESDFSGAAGDGHGARHSEFISVIWTNSVDSTFDSPTDSTN